MEQNNEEKRPTVTELLQDIADQICTEYCRYKFEVTDEDRLDTKCSNCPLVQLI